MKLLYSIVILFILGSCSFDNKSGIWKNENNAFEENDITFKDFKKITSETEIFNSEISFENNQSLKIDVPFQNQSWKDIHFSKNNNLKNFKYNDLNQVVFKSKKLTKNQINNYLLFENNKLILSDKRGNIIIYSKKDNLVISKFNFYKKKYKKLDKFLNLIVDKNIIFVSDNIGFIYAYNYETNKIIWAKKLKVPFRSNIKLNNEKLITANQNNDLFIIDKTNGKIKKLIPTEDTIINNTFVNNISLNENNIFFLNTYGSLYSINIDNFKFNWFINLNKNINLDLSNLFYGSELVNYGNKIIVSSDQYFYVINSKTGTIFTKKNFSLAAKPIINNNYIFLVTKNNLLLAMDADKGEIIFSHDIGLKIANFINSKKKSLNIKNLMLVNNKLFLFLKNSYIVQFNLKGDIIKIIKLSSRINSQQIFIDSFLFYLDKKNKLIVLN